VSRLAKCALLAGDVERACAIGKQAIDLVVAVGSSRVVERLSEFETALAPVRSAAAEDFRESFGGTLGISGWEQSLRSMRSSLYESGLSAEEFDEYIEVLRSPGFSYYSPLVVRAFGHTAIPGPGNERRVSEATLR